jgi:SAM-dependent methyltransferase
MMTKPYSFDTADLAERDRLAAQGAQWDPFTFRVLEDVGVDDGWRCLEIGAGTGSVASWLVDRTGTRGHVVATDIEPRWLDDVRAPTLEVRRHDVERDDIERGEYDLVHARLVLEHLPLRHVVLDRLVAALRPGGWLVIEDYDTATISVAHPHCEAWSKVVRAVIEVMEARGADLGWGRRLPAALHGHPLADVEARGTVLVLRSDEFAAMFGAAIEAMRGAVLVSSAVTPAEFDDAMGELASVPAQLSYYSPIFVSARGRRV